MFVNICVPAILIGLLFGGFFLTCMFDDKQQYKCTFGDFIRWLREACTKYNESSSDKEKTDA